MPTLENFVKSYFPQLKKETLNTIVFMPNMLDILYFREIMI